MRPTDRLSADYILGRDDAMTEVHKGLEYIKAQLVMMKDQNAAERLGLGVGLVQLKLAEIQYHWADQSGKATR